MGDRLKLVYHSYRSNHHLVVTHSGCNDAGTPCIPRVAWSVQGQSACCHLHDVWGGGCICHGAGVIQSLRHHVQEM